MFDTLRNMFLNQDRYRTNSQAVIVSCFFNPQKSPYRLLAFQKWYRSIKHLPHRIIECVIGDEKPQLASLNDPDITTVHSESLLWHKESLLNKVISELPQKYKYVFWLDADVKFTNLDWLTDSVKELQTSKIVQPFEYCVHLDRNQTEPNFDMQAAVAEYEANGTRNPKMWRSFCANYADDPKVSADKNYDIHGHVGFAWGARREVLDEVPLFDHALIGGADHIVAHAAAGQIPHECIIKGFKDNLDEIELWMNRFYEVVQGQIGYVPGYLYHYWHGDVEKRQYLKRIKDFTATAKQIDQRDANGLFVRKNDKYLKNYFDYREVGFDEVGFEGFDEGFVEDMGYLISDIIQGPVQNFVDQAFGSPVEEVTTYTEDQGAGSAVAEPYADNEVSNEISAVAEDTQEEYLGAGSDAVENYPDNESDSTENFS